MAEFIRGKGYFLKLSKPRKKKDSKMTMDKPATARLDQNRKMIDAYPIQVSALCEEEGGDFQALFPPLASSVVGYGVTPQETIIDL